MHGLLQQRIFFGVRHDEEALPEGIQGLLPGLEGAERDLGECGITSSQPP
jgi:hypothetical protein